MDAACFKSMEEVFFNCPYCGAEVSVLCDTSIPRQEYIEDCEVCCRPLEFIVTAEESEITSFQVEAVEQ